MKFLSYNTIKVSRYEVFANLMLIPRLSVPDRFFHSLISEKLEGKPGWVVSICEQVSP